MRRLPTPSASSLHRPIPITIRRYAQPQPHSHVRLASLHPATTVRATINGAYKPISNSQFSQEQQTSQPQVNSPSRSSLVLSSTPAPQFTGKHLRQIQPSPELGLLHLLFVVSMAVGAILSVAVISIPTMISLRRLGVSVGRLKKVIAREIPGSAFSLRLSEKEINELTKQIKSLRQKISRIKGDGNSGKSRNFGGGNDPASK